MRVIVLGSAAGGGFPQWNSAQDGCRRALSGDAAAPARTQASIAVSADGHRWALMNASPDLRQQIIATPALHAQVAPRSSPIAAVLLTGGDVDAIAGLLTLREKQAFALYATPEVLGILDANSVFEVLDREVVARRPVEVAAWQDLLAADGAPLGLRVRPFAVPGKVPLYQERAGEAPAVVEGEQTIGLEIADERATLFYIPGCAAMTPGLAARLQGAECVLFDGTLWADDEMIAAGLGAKTGRRMGHMSVSGAEGTLAAFAGLRVRRRVLIHINNSNPILLADAPERAAAEAAGWEVAFDGMTLDLEGGAP